MKKWKFFNLMQTAISTILILIAGYFWFSIGTHIAILSGAICLGIGITIQTLVLQVTFVRDKLILTELKDYENLLKATRDEIKEIPHFIKTNNSEIANYIKTNTSEICRYSDDKI